jgi:hypothetical protein
MFKKRAEYKIKKARDDDKERTVIYRLFLFYSK